MRVLILASQKGGSGKSTLVASLAVAATQDAETVAVIDLDPQGSLAAWGRRRATTDIEVSASEPAKLDQALRRIETQASRSLIIIDTPGVFGASVNLVLQSGDLVMIPVKPSILDVEAARPLVAQLQRLDRQFAFVLNQCLASSQARTIDAAKALVKSGALAPSMVAVRTDFLDAMTAGAGVTEMAPNGKAAGEVQLLWQWIKSRLNGVERV